MQKNEVKIGGVYIAKVTNKLVQVRIDAESRYGGWDGVSLASNKKVRIRSATKLRSAVGADTVVTKAKKSGGCKKAKATSQAQLPPTSAPTVETGAKPESAPGACPNCGSTERDEEGDCAQCHEPKVAGPEAKTKQPRAKKTKSDKPKRMSGLDAAAKVLDESSEPMNVKQIVEMADSKGYWKSPGGKTPHATVYSAMLRECAKKGSDSRFRKTERGKFERNR